MKDKFKWVIACLIVLVAVMMLKFDVIAIHLFSALSGIISERVIFFVLAAILVTMTATAMYLMKENPDWFKSICADVGSGAGNILDGILRPISETLFSFDKLLLLAGAGLAAYFIIGMRETRPAQITKIVSPSLTNSQRRKPASLSQQDENIDKWLGEQESEKV